jgi:hypothetical protein
MRVFPCRRHGYDFESFFLSEPFKVRAQRLARARLLRLCAHCLHTHRRCHDSLRAGRSRCWKTHRLAQWRPVRPLVPLYADDGFASG